MLILYLYLLSAIETIISIHFYFLQNERAVHERTCRTAIDKQNEINTKRDQIHYEPLKFYNLQCRGIREAKE